VKFNKILALIFISLLVSFVFGQSKSKPSDKFRQLEEDLPTPNEYRTASGSPGHKYWQQRADYIIDVELDDLNQTISGKETVTYKNFSPDTLNYIWLQLDQNILAKDADSVTADTNSEIGSNVPLQQIQQLAAREYDGKINITNVSDSLKKPLKYTINKTMMRIDLPKPLTPNQQFIFNVAWNFKINDGALYRERTSYEYFPNDKNYLYTIAHWFPRLAAYNDVSGWQHKQFLGSGEFTLEFGNYLVRLTTPNDHVVSATGVLQNPAQVLKPEWIKRLKQAETAKEPIKIVTQDEAIANESNKPTGKKTWIFKADNVRDFAFASSRKFIWDAQGHNVEGNKVMAMSLYPKEGNPLWEKYSTKAIIHTLNVYSRYSFTYPYPNAISVNNRWVGGMEYPMICFNGPRANADMKTYSDQAKWGLIGVVIHEVGHNYFPMVVNSDERQWTWMDEGLNTFLQYLSEKEWEGGFPSRRGPPKFITDYMLSENQVPIMTNSESVLQFGANAYAKPATALNILRETVMGRELFDFAFKTYAKRWKFKRPMPADFFRTMEDASGVDLDWFWRGWFYTTDHVDISIEDVKLFKVDKKTPEELKDPQVAKQYEDFMATLTEKEKSLINTDYHFYFVKLKNKGGLVMPLIFKLEFTDGTSEIVRIPAEIWRYNNFDVSKLLVSKKEAKNIILDPNEETADTDKSNNSWKKVLTPTKFQVFKTGQGRRQPPTTTTTSAVAVNPANNNVTGKWNIAVDAGGQTLTVVLNLTQDGNNITGTIDFPQGSIPISSGVMENGTFTIKTTTPIAFTIIGTRVDNSISGSFEAPQGSTTFSGSKAP
jgi:virulence-associated protein VagC